MTSKSITRDFKRLAQQSAKERDARDRKAALERRQKSAQKRVIRFQTAGPSISGNQSAGSLIIGALLTLMLLWAFTRIGVVAQPEPQIGSGVHEVKENSLQTLSNQ